MRQVTAAESQTDIKKKKKKLLSISEEINSPKLRVCLLNPDEKTEVEVVCSAYLIVCS